MSLNNEVPLMTEHDELCLKLIRYLTGNQSKEFTMGVICDEWEVRVTIRAIEFYPFCKR